jgi:hypothetical protein
MVNRRRMPPILNGVPRLSPCRRRLPCETLHGCLATRTGEVVVSKWLSDRIVEEAGRRIYESQQSRLSDRTTFAAKRAWRSDDVPEMFWDSYVEDARAALSLTSIAGAYSVVREEHSVTRRNSGAAAMAAQLASKG